MEVYRLHRYKATQFECNIDLNGASLSDATARLVVESDELTLLFQGSISRNGKCTISIPRLKGLMEELTSGEMRLEVIVEDTYFQPWSSPFRVDESKRVNVTEVAGQKKKVTVVVANSPSNNLTERIVRELHSNGVTVSNIGKRRATVFKCIIEHIRSGNKKIDPKSLIPSVVKGLELLGS